MLDRLEVDLEKLSKREPYSCCGGDPECAVNKSERFIDGLFDLFMKDRNAAKDHLFMYMESVETDRDWNKFKLKEALAEIQKLKEKTNEFKG